MHFEVLVGDAKIARVVCHWSRAQTLDLLSQFADDRVTVAKFLLQFVAAKLVLSAKLLFLSSERLLQLIWISLRLIILALLLLHVGILLFESELQRVNLGLQQANSIIVIVDEFLNRDFLLLFEVQKLVLVDLVVLLVEQVLLPANHVELLREGSSFVCDLILELLDPLLVRAEGLLVESVQLGFLVFESLVALSLRILELGSELVVCRVEIPDLVVFALERHLVELVLIGEVILEVSHAWLVLFSSSKLNLQSLLVLISLLLQILNLSSIAILKSLDLLLKLVFKLLDFEFVGADGLLVEGLKLSLQVFEGVITFDLRILELGCQLIVRQGEFSDLIVFVLQGFLVVVNLAVKLLLETPKARLVLFSGFELEIKGLFVLSCLIHQVLSLSFMIILEIFYFQLQGLLVLMSLVL